MGRYRRRIVTFKRIAGLLHKTPKTMLYEGSRTITDEKVRVFTVRDVFYDDGMTPLFSMPTLGEPEELSVQELKTNYPHYDWDTICDSPILDNENYLKVWEDESDT